MRIVTFTCGGGPVQAMTEAEFVQLPDDWDEFVWQDQPSKEAAVARHDEAFEAWRDNINAGRPEKKAY